MNLMLDVNGVPPLHQRVYALARRLLPGQTVTYGEIARPLGDPGAARAVAVRRYLASFYCYKLSSCLRIFNAGQRPIQSSGEAHCGFHTTSHRC